MRHPTLLCRPRQLTLEAGDRSAEGDHEPELPWLGDLQGRVFPTEGLDDGARPEDGHADPGREPEARLVHQGSAAGRRCTDDPATPSAIGRDGSAERTKDGIGDGPRVRRERCMDGEDRDIRERPAQDDGVRLDGPFSHRHRLSGST